MEAQVDAAQRLRIVFKDSAEDPRKIINATRRVIARHYSVFQAAAELPLPDGEINSDITASEHCQALLHYFE